MFPGDKESFMHLIWIFSHLESNSLKSKALPPPQEQAMEP